MSRDTIYKASVLVCAAAVLCSLSSDAGTPASPPNIVLILVDDLGWGDLGCYGADLVDTPNIDALARAGTRFMNAYAPMPICTPTRYSIMTGEHYFRAAGRNFSRGQALIRPGTPCLPQLLKSQGYRTACFGKWHLGFGDTGPDWNGDLKPGPLEIGFDYFYGTPVTHNEAPNVLAEDHRVLGLDPADPIVLPKGWGSHKPTQGGKAAQALKVNENLGTDYAGRVINWLEKQQPDSPFFLYFATPNVHVSLSPHPRFHGKSRAGLYGDYIAELDWMVGEVLQTLEKQGMADNTLVVFTSDNGAIYERGSFDLGHRCNGSLPGQKTDVWMGGCRIPFLARWPGRVPAGRTSDELISLLDFYPMTAALLGQTLPEGAALDGMNMLPALLDTPGHSPVREFMVFTGIPFSADEKTEVQSLIPAPEPAALIVPPWMYVAHQGSGGVTSRWGWGMMFNELDIAHSDYGPDGKLLPGAPPGQLYRLDQDPFQSANVYRKYPEKAAELHDRLVEEMRFRHTPRSFEE